VNYSAQWTFEGTAYYAALDNSPGSQPVYRFWSPALSSHFYTISTAERDKLMAKSADVWNYEGPAFYAYPAGAQPQNARAVYRFWSNILNYHFYTIDATERDKLIRGYGGAWTYEGVAWYAYP
jgi:lysyl endopeptidase